VEDDHFKLQEQDVDDACDIGTIIIIGKTALF
jgi:hypothetical protein